MSFSPKKFLSSVAIAVAMTVGLAAPASAFTLTADPLSIERGGFVNISTDAPETHTAALFVNGEHVETDVLGGSTGGFPWEMFGPCVDIDVTFRLYDETYVDQVKDFADSYDDSVTIEFVGDNTVECNDTWGAGESTGSDESLAKTGSDASTVASLTGVAGVAAIVVAAAVAFRLRRAQR